MPAVYGEGETGRMIFFSRRNRHEREAAEHIYAASVRAARRPALYHEFDVPDTLDGRFEMIALHLFAVIHRLMHDPGDDPKLARLVAEVFVADMDGAFREMGVSDLRVPKRMAALYRSFAGRLAAYRKALEEGDKALASTVARNIFPDMQESGQAAALADYMRACVAALRVADAAGLRRGAAPFPEPVRVRNEEPGA